MSENPMTGSMPKRKTPVVRVVAFLLLFLAAFLLVSHLLRPVSYNRKIIGGFYDEPGNTLDMVYVGGSACFVYWAPMVAWQEYGIASYNFGSSTMPADALKYCLTEILKTQSPKLIVMDIRPFQYRDARYPTEVAIRDLTDNLSYSLNRAALVAEIVPRTQQAGTVEYQLDLGKYHGRWQFLHEDSFTYLLNVHHNPDKGFHFVPKVAAQPYYDLRQVQEKTPVSAQTDAVLTDLLEFCRQKQLNVLFVTNSYAETPEDRRIYNYLQERVEKSGFAYLNTHDLNDKVGLDYSVDLYDKNHVNIFGAEKFTRFLAGYLVTRYDLPDRRSDPGYNQWSKDFVQWSEHVTAAKAAINKLLAEAR